MQQNMGYPVFWTNQPERPPVLTRIPMYPPPPFVDFKRKKRKDGTCVYLLIMFLLVLLALTGVGMGTYKIFLLQKELNHVKEFSNEASSMQSGSPEKLIGFPMEKKINRQAAHVTAKQSENLPLVWDDKTGRAFTSGIRYKERGLVINESGLHFLYSSIYFTDERCIKDRLELVHVVYKKPLRYPAFMKLMENSEFHSCRSSGMWGRHSYLGAVFNLTHNDILYVNVSDVKLVSHDETKTFFGLYKL
ncbi:tumor necrosis factor ligand superfamily member 6 [Hyperolius riggenbachi]|uniref:tumor necrosis factor ligand superfamily member 6 n=1 Tax=Hyperolius riggenbachi TaxID=752182 RepID=UPI0035A343A1